MEPYIISTSYLYYPLFCICLRRPFQLLPTESKGKTVRYLTFKYKVLYLCKFAEQENRTQTEVIEGIIAERYLETCFYEYHRATYRSGAYRSRAWFALAR